MEITRVEIHEFEYDHADVGTRPDGEAVYDPGAEATGVSYVLEVHTDAGVVGRYRDQIYAAATVPQILGVAEQFLLGRDPLDRESIWFDLRRALRHTGHLAIGPVDVALWDLAGKHYGEDVATLLGGRMQERVPAYASTMSGSPEHDTPSTYADFARDCRDRGYPAFKIHPLGDPDRDVEVCRAVADAVGDDMDLMLDPSSCYRRYADALAVGRALDELDFAWYEDPLRDTGDSAYAMRRLADELDTPLLGLEHSRTEPFGAIDHLFEDALDLVRVDAHLGGGLTGAMKTVHTVQSAGMDVEPHLGGAAHLHLLSAVPNARYFEHGLLHPEVGFEWTNNLGYAEPIEVVDDDGMVAVPEGPGLGIDIDWDWVEERRTERHVVD